MYYQRPFSAADARNPIHMLTTYPRSAPLKKLRKSCRFCRTRKIKCDGNQPCLACQNRQKCSCIYEEQAQMGRPKKCQSNKFADQTMSAYTSKVSELGASVPGADVGLLTDYESGLLETGSEHPIMSPHHPTRCDPVKSDCCFHFPERGVMGLTTEFSRQPLEPFWQEVRRTMRSEGQSQIIVGPASENTQSSSSPNAQYLTSQDPLSTHAHCLVSQQPESRKCWSHNQAHEHQQYMNETFEDPRMIASDYKHVENPHPTAMMSNHYYGYPPTPSLSNTVDSLGANLLTPMSALSPPIIGSTLRLPPPSISLQPFTADPASYHSVPQQTMSPVYHLSAANFGPLPPSSSQTPLVSPHLPPYKLDHDSRYVSI